MRTRKGLQIGALLLDLAGGLPSPDPPVNVVLKSYISPCFFHPVCPSCQTSLGSCCIFVYPMHWIDTLISFFRLSVCLLTDRLSNDYVHNSLPIFTKFCMRLRNVVASSPILFVRETGSSLRILEVCGFQFWQFSGCGDRIFQQISTKSHTQIKFSNADFVFNGEWNRKQK